VANERSLNVRITGDSRDFGRMVSSVDRDSDRLQKRFAVVGDSANGLSLRVGAVAGSFGQLAPLLATAVPALAAVGGAAATLAASFASAAAGAGALGAGLGASLAPIVVVGKQVTSRLEEIKKAHEAVQTAQKNGTEANRKAAAEAMAGLSKSEREMAGALDRLSGLQTKVLGGASDRIFSALAGAVKRVAPVLEGLRGPFNNLGDAIGGSIDRISKALSGNAWSGALKAFVSSASKLVGPITTIFMSIGNVMRDVATAALPMVQDAVKGVADKFRDIDKAATTGKIRAIVGELVDQTKSWFNLFKAVGGLVVHVFSGSASQGKSLVDTLTKIVKAVDGFVVGMREGSGSGGKFAGAVVSAFNTAKSAVSRAVTAIRGWLKDHREDIQSVIQAFKRVASFAKDTWEETLLPVVRRTVRAIKPIVEGSRARSAASSARLRPALGRLGEDVERREGGRQGRVEDHQDDGRDGCREPDGVHPGSRAEADQGAREGDGQLAEGDRDRARERDHRGREGRAGSRGERARRTGSRDHVGDLEGPREDQHLRRRAREGRRPRDHDVDPAVRDRRGRRGPHGRAREHGPGRGHRLPVRAPRLLRPASRLDHLERERLLPLHRRGAGRGGHPGGNARVLPVHEEHDGQPARGADLHARRRLASRTASRTRTPARSPRTTSITSTSRSTRALRVSVTASGVSEARATASASARSRACGSGAVAPAAWLR
jgi:hypothetical protein